MAQVDQINRLNEAIPLYVSVGLSPYPKEDGARLLDRYGSEEGNAVLKEVLALMSELQSIEPDWEYHSLISGARWAVNQLKINHENLTDECGAALEWIYSWWLK